MTRPADKTPEQAKQSVRALRERILTLRTRQNTAHTTLTRMNYDNHFGPDVARAMKGIFP